MRLFAALLVACLAVSDAAAGAWTLAKGSGQIVMTTGRKIAPAGAYFSGVPEKDSNTAQIFVEYGVAERWTLGASIHSDISTTDLDALEIRAGAHLRHRLWTGRQGDVVSAQLGFAAPIERWIIGNRLADGLPHSVPEAHIRALYGRGWEWGLGNSFVTTEGGFHWRGEGAANELHLDLGAGHEAWKGVLGLLGIYSIMPLGSGGERSLKLAPSIAWTIWPRIGPNDKKPRGKVNPNTVQLGVIWDALNPGDGLGAQISLWRSF